MAVTSTNNLRQGSSGSDVLKLQKLLNQNGYNLAENGSFDNNTLVAVKDYQQKNKLKVDGIVGTNTWGALTKASSSTPTASATPAESKAPTFNYTKSDAVAQAEALLQQQLANKPGAWQGGTWMDALNETINKINNREDFSYDLNGDMLYQQYKDQYITQGKLASMDAMGQVAAMNGGYGNSYAQTAGQQAYQAYLQQLNDVVPELYGMALDRYNQEGQELYDQAALYGQQVQQEYGMYQDELDRYYTDLQYLTDNARYMTETEYQQALDDFNIKYGAYRDDVADQQWHQSFQYQQERDRVADQQWQKQYDEDIRQHDNSAYTQQLEEELELLRRQFDTQVEDVTDDTGSNKTPTRTAAQFRADIMSRREFSRVSSKYGGNYKAYIEEKLEEWGEYMSDEDIKTLANEYGLWS